MVVEFNVYKRKIKNPNPYLVNNSKNYVKFKFIFNNEIWIGLNKYIIFKYKEKKMIRYLGNECVCEIDVPNELMEYNFIKFKIQGKDDDYEVILTKSLVIPLEKSGFTEDTFVYGGEN
jgi:hypothetical protein